jgi:hypothetical protein
MNFKLTVLVAIAAFTTVTFGMKAFAQNSTLLLEFSNGNQIYGSTLLINTDGTVIHSERTCCPPHSTPAPEASLTKPQLLRLSNLISAVATQPTIAKKGHRTSEGSESGALHVYPTATPIVLHQILRGGMGELDQVTYNISSEAQEIEQLVNSFVKYPLYQ